MVMSNKFRFDCSGDSRWSFSDFLSKLNNDKQVKEIFAAVDDVDFQCSCCCFALSHCTDAMLEKLKNVQFRKDTKVWT